MNKLIGKLRAFGKLLKRIRCMLNVDISMTLIKALVLPLLDLYDVIYATACDSVLKSLDVCFNDLLRIVLRLDRRVHFPIDALYDSVHLRNLNDRRNVSLKFLMIRICSGSIFCKCCLNWRKRSHRYDSRSKDLFEKHWPRTNFGRCMIAYRGINLYNLLHQQ